MRGAESETRIRTRLVLYPASPTYSACVACVPSRVSGCAVPRPGTAHRFIDHALRDLNQLGVLALADLPPSCERFLRSSTGATAQRSDRLVDHRSRTQRLLQLGGERPCLGQHVRVVDGDGGRRGKQLAEVRGMLA